METSATFVVLICALVSSLIEANSNYDGTFKYCKKTGPTSEICKPWDSSAVVEIETEDVYEEGIPTLNLYFKEDSFQKFRKLNLTEGAYKRFNISTSLVFDGVNIDGASGPFINQDKVKAISLMNNGLQEFPRDFFRGLGLQLLSFSGNWTEHRCQSLFEHLDQLRLGTCGHIIIRKHKSAMRL
ncbi:uncharacterized protein [Fopius arisanus]|uniref:Uncharacterized protein isoform X2 n=1 Tax=Fopius arisanus TaxID=64838 RepID=A0A9R1TSU0_9HYME|nr:PREDICTED: uncharacterized protein LOC105273710 isoform X2 [Fopius arisanus]